MTDSARIRQRATAGVPWSQARFLRFPAVQVERSEARAAVAHRGPVLLSGPPWSGRTTALEQVGRQLLHAGIAPDRIGWVELGQAAWRDCDLPTVVAAFEDGPPSAILLDDLPADTVEWLLAYRGPVRLIATRAGVVASSLPLSPWTFWRALRTWDVGVPLPGGASTEEVLRSAMRLSDASDALAEPLRRYLLLGAFPALLLSPNRDPAVELAAAQQAVAARVLDRTLFKQIPLDTGIREPAVLEALLADVARSPGELLAPSAVAARLGITQPTVDKYLDALARAGLVHQLRNGFEANPRRGRRVLFVDGAVRNAVLRLGVHPLVDPEEMGHLLFHSVISHVVAWARRAGTEVGHWRRGRLAVDIVVRHPGGPLALQMGSSRTALESLRAFTRENPDFESRGWLLLHRAPPTWPAHHESGVGRIAVVPFLVALGMALEPP